MQHKIAIGLMLMIFSMIAIILLSEYENDQTKNQPAPEVNKLISEVKKTDIPEVKTAKDIKKPEVKSTIIQGKKSGKDN